MSTPLPAARGRRANRSSLACLTGVRSVSTTIRLAHNMLLKHIMLVGKMFVKHEPRRTAFSA